MMAGLVKKVFSGAAIALGAAAIASPASAGTLTRASIAGTAPTDFFVYDVSGTNTVKIDSTLANVQKVLDGSATNPTGNVELRASSEQSGFDFAKNTTLSGTIGGKMLALSSLTADDWNTAVGGRVAFARTWFNAALNANGFNSLLGTSTYDNLWTKFNTGGGRERFSDPNIAYVSQDDTTGVISIGLAGHYDATSLLFGNLSASELSALSAFRDPSQQGLPIQASEVVKYTYNNTTGFLYNFSATRSRLVASNDGFSHTGNYEVSIAGVPTARVPEPSLMLGLAGLGGFFAVKRQVKNA